MTVSLSTWPEIPDPIPADGPIPKRLLAVLASSYPWAPPDTLQPARPGWYAYRMCYDNPRREMFLHLIYGGDWDEPDRFLPWFRYQWWNGDAWSFQRAELTFRNSPLVDEEESA